MVIYALKNVNNAVFYVGGENQMKFMWINLLESKNRR